VELDDDIGMHPFARDAPGTAAFIPRRRRHDIEAEVAGIPYERKQASIAKGLGRMEKRGGMRRAHRPIDVLEIGSDVSGRVIARLAVERIDRNDTAIVLSFCGCKRVVVTGTTLRPTHAVRFTIRPGPVDPDGGPLAVSLVGSVEHD